MPVPGMLYDRLTPFELIVVFAPRGPIEIDAPYLPRLIDNPGNIVIRFWNLILIFYDAT